MTKSKKVIVVTGASQGIGAEVVKAFRKLDYRIVATSRSIKPSNDENILSIAGDIGDPTTAQRVISECVARFGRVDTPIGRMGETSDIADAILFLDSAPFITGEILHVDGGQSAGR